MDFTLQQSLGLDICHELITVPHTQRRALSERRPLYERRTEYNTGPPPASTKYVALFLFWATISNLTIVMAHFPDVHTL